MFRVSAYANAIARRQPFKSSCLSTSRHQVERLGGNELATSKHEQASKNTQNLTPSKAPFIQLSKRTDKGKSMIWQAFLEDSCATIVWGLEDGKKQLVTRTVTEGKQKRNIREQLELEARSAARKKIQKDGYVVDIGDVPLASVPPKAEATSSAAVSDATPPLPMLAKTWTEKALKPVAVHIQPKLDGLRCIADIVTGDLWSRARKKFEGLDHISDSLLRMNLRDKLASHGIRFIDGEIYTHGLDFQEITSRARRLPGNFHENSNELQFYAFDVCAERLSFSNRWSVLAASVQSSKISGSSGEAKSSVVLCPTEAYDNAVKMDIASAAAKWISAGYEGLMVRLSLGDSQGYRPGIRSSDLLKYKVFQQEEYEVVGFRKHRELDTLGSVILKLKSGETFSATPAQGSHSKLEMWQNRQYYEKPGWMATVKFQELSRTGVPRFPVLVGFRHEFDR